MKRSWSFAPVGGVLALVALWALVVELGQVPAYVLPSPFAVLVRAVEQRESLATGLASTALSASVGFGIAAVVGLLLGSLFRAIPWLRRAFYPLANLLQMVPVVAIAPILTIWLGYGSPSVIACATLVAIFPVIANTVDGLMRVDPKLRELFAIYGFSATQRWRKLELRAAAPQIFTGLRIAAGLSVIGTVVGEFVSGYLGSFAPLGVVILAALRQADTPLVFAAVGACALVGFALFFLVHLLSRVWVPKT